MGKRLVIPVSTFVLAFVILFTSIVQSSSVQYVFSQSPSEVPYNIPDVDYQLPGTGLVGPDNPMWMLEAIRDKALLELTVENYDKSELLLKVADKRIADALQLAHRGEYEKAMAVSKKAEMYLESSYNHLRDIEELNKQYVSLCTTLSTAALKHRAVLEEIYAQAPEDARPAIAQATDTPKKIYEYTTHMLNDVRAPIVDNPFLTNY